MTAQPESKKLTVAEFLAWAETQSEGRYELVDGEILAMAPERLRHNLGKTAVFDALRAAVARSGVPCRVFADGIGIEIEDRHWRIPDVSVQCNVDIDLDATMLKAPIIVVEVVSPSSERDDTGDKLVEYFSVPSIRHYLIVRLVQRAIIHHARDEAGAISTRIVQAGELDLTPPGVRLAFDDMMPVVG